MARWKPQLPDAARKPPALVNKRKMNRTLQVAPESRYLKAVSDFIMGSILEPVITAACEQGEGVLQARERQRRFERRLLQKSVCSASLIGWSATCADASSTLAFLPRDGLCVLGSTPTCLPAQP